MLIYLNGTSSSGKTSIAIEIQKLLNVPCFYFSIDTILYSLAKEDLEAIMGKRPYRSPLDWESIFAGYFSCVAGLLNSGNRVIADCPIYNAKLEKDFNKFLNSIPNKAIIKISCSLTELEKRERGRGDRVIGVAKRQFDSIHNHLKYDFAIESDKLKPIEAAEKILSHLGPII